MKIFIGIFVCGFLAIVNGQEPDSGESLPPIFELRKAIFKNYDKLVRPIKEADDVVPVWANLSPFAVLDVNVKYKIVELDTWIFIRWENPLLTWDPSKFDGIEEIRMNPSEVWTPDITLLSATPYKYLVPPPSTKVLMNHNGTNLWVLPFTFRTQCLQPKLQGNTFECTSLIGSFVYNTNLLELHPYPESIQQNPLHNYYDHNPDWSLESITVEKGLMPYQCTVFCKEKFGVLKFKMTFKKRPVGYDGYPEENDKDDD